MTHLKQLPIPAWLSRVLYLITMVTSIVFFSIGNISQGGIYLGIALLFDPFDRNQPFPKRPFYQKFILIGQAVGALLAILADFIM